MIQSDLFKEDSENEKNGEKEKPFEQIGIASGEIFRGIDKGNKYILAQLDGSHSKICTYKLIFPRMY